MTRLSGGKPRGALVRSETEVIQEQRGRSPATIDRRSIRRVADLDIFVSFEFDKDRDLRDSFYAQARLHTRHRVRNCSLREAYPTEEWKREAREAIRECDAVIVLVGEDTHNAPGVRTEVDMARSFGKPTLQVRPRARTYTGVSGIGDAVPWRWTRINEFLDAI